MEKDYIPSKNFPQEVIDSYQIPYAYQDHCVDHYVEYLRCLRINPKLFENGLLYALPFSNSFSKCGILKKQWLKCQDYREKQIFEEMRLIHLDEERNKNKFKIIEQAIE